MEGKSRLNILNGLYVYLNILQEFVEKYRKNGSIKDGIVDEHSLLLFIQFSAERPKRNRRGVDISGTFLGAVSPLYLLFYS